MSPRVHPGDAEEDVQRAASLSRRRFLALTGSAAAAALVPGAASAARTLVSRLEAEEAAVLSFRTRPDLQPPAISAAAAGSTAPGSLFVASVTGPGQRGPMIVDDRGQPVWLRPLSKRTAMDFRVQRYKGAPVLTWWEGGIDGGHGQGECVIVGASYREVARVRAGNGYSADLHEFLLTDRGTALLAIYQPLPYDLSPVGGPASGTLLESIVQEVDVASGRVLLEWHARDHVDLAETLSTVTDAPFDWFHVNSIDVDTDGNLLVSARHTSAVYKVDRRSGAVIWRLGGKRSDFALGPGVEFWGQHDVRRQPDGTLTIFDNGSPPKREQSSRALSLTLDEGAKRAALARALVHPDGLLAVAMGSVQPLADGGTLVGWGTTGRYSEFAPDGTLRLDASFAGGGQTYRAYRLPWSGRPGARPVLAVAGNTGGKALFASWNGATEVRRWRLDAGPSPSALRRIGTAARAGFETRIPIPWRTGYAAVSALDERGRVLATSKTVRL